MFLYTIFRMTWRKWNESYVHTKTFKWVFIVALFIIASNWKCYRCLLAGEWATDWGTSVQRNTIHPPRGTDDGRIGYMGESQKHYAFSERSQTQNATLYMIPFIYSCEVKVYGQKKYQRWLGDWFHCKRKWGHFSRWWSVLDCLGTYTTTCVCQILPYVNYTSLRTITCEICYSLMANLPSSQTLKMPLFFNLVK